MNLVHLKPSDYLTSTWSGGTTTQVGIAPAGAVYADRDFMWRVSSATVDLDVSDFSALPDYNRLIATLEGSIDVTHNGGEVIHLPEFKVHAFDGGWETRSVGRCRDFNLMTRKGACTGRMEAVKVGPGASAEVRTSEAAAAASGPDLILYCAKGAAKVEGIELQVGEAVRLQGPGCLTVTADEEAVLMLTEAWY
jgi:environmental stress-induced protein Ves